ncbi:putative ferroxidase [Medicago truncatula]|uniref:Putative ferroxidase n=1 Tax=Medicago truncatula TaxID=3880 RepID=A0A396HG21_MEDTR|nr:putative ferroxidase [Medicago truncatula]
MASKLLLQRRLFRFLRQSQESLYSFSSSSSIQRSSFHSAKQTEILGFSTSSRSFCSRKSSLVDESNAPAPIDYTSLLQEGEFHRLAESTIHSLQEKFEDYGDFIDLDGFDIDYAVILSSRWWLIVVSRALIRGMGILIIFVVIVFLPCIKFWNLWCGAFYCLLNNVDELC